MVISLIGYRGSGKSTVARFLAERLGWDWIDADDYLQEKMQRSIKQIFSEEGEPYFRQKEREFLLELLKRDRLVLATGGGVILNPDSRHDLKLGGPVVWLRAAPLVLAQRLGEDRKTASQRPSLTGAPPIEEITTVLAQRGPLYEATASMVLDSDQMSPEQLAVEIEKRLIA